MQCSNENCFLLYWACIYKYWGKGVNLLIMKREVVKSLRHIIHIETKDVRPVIAEPCGIVRTDDSWWNHLRTCLNLGVNVGCWISGPKALRFLGGSGKAKEVNNWGSLKPRYRPYGEAQCTHLTNEKTMVLKAPSLSSPFHHVFYPLFWKVLCELLSIL